MHVTRVRRGKEIVVPQEWIGRVCTDKTKRHRKNLAKVKRKDRKKRVRREQEIFEMFFW